MNPAQRHAAELVALGRDAAAEVALRRLVQRDPRDATAQHLLAGVLLRLGKPEQALHYAERSIGIDATRADYYNVLGGALTLLDRHEPAARAFERAVEINPTHASSWHGLALARMQRRQTDDALIAARRALELDPRSTPHAVTCSILLDQTFHPTESIRVVREALAQDPDHHELALQLAAASNYSSELSAEESRAAHLRAGELLNRHHASTARPPAPTDPAGRALRVGFLSRDLRDHSVARFLEPLLVGRDRSTLWAACYSTADAPDHVSDRLRTLCDRWVDASRLDDQAAAGAIRRDDLDVLLELGGYTSGSRLGICVRRAAPAQATFLGYPNTLGIPAITWRLVDSTTDPSGSDGACSERLLRLDPCFLCYQGPHDAPEPLMREPGPPRLGSFNLLSKVSTRTLDLWARVLREIPDATLLLKSSMLSSGGARARTVEEFARRGVREDRLVLVDHLPDPRDHLSLYHHVDVALDPFPYHGTTTTCEALWMGVPVVTLEGDRHAARVGCSLLRCVARPEWIARDEDGYVALAASLARDQQALAHQRQSLRRDMLHSPLCDAPGYARRFESLLRSALLHHRPAP